MNLLFGTLLLLCCFQESLGFVDRRRLTPYIVGKKYRWPNGRIPYTISGRLSRTLKSRVHAAIKSWNAQVKVKWIKRSRERYFVEFRPGRGCSSHIGMRKDWFGRRGRQYINLGGWCKKGNIQHEMMHATGFHHTHVRSDRDRYVKVTSNNHNYVIPRGYANCEEYDFGSIMHYPENRYIKRIVDPRGKKIGQRENLSPQDIRCINSIYGFVDKASRLCQTNSRYKRYVNHYCFHAKNRYASLARKGRNCRNLVIKSGSYCVTSTCKALKPGASASQIQKLANNACDSFIKIYKTALKCYQTKRVCRTVFSWRYRRGCTSNYVRYCSRKRCYRRRVCSGWRWFRRCRYRRQCYGGRCYTYRRGYKCKTCRVVGYHSAHVMVGKQASVVKTVRGGSQMEIVVNSTQLLVLFVVCVCVAGCAFAMVFHFVGKLIAGKGKKQKYKQLSFHDEDSSSNPE